MLKLVSQLLYTVDIHPYSPMGDILSRSVIKEATCCSVILYVTVLNSWEQSQVLDLGPKVRLDKNTSP